MTADPAFLAFLADISARLPAPYRFDALDPDPASPIGREAFAAMRGEPASLPYCGTAQINWVSLAPSAESLRGLIEDLRCWVVPSFGWEATPAIMLPGAGGGAFATTLIARSPAGYFRWQSQPTAFDPLVDRIALMRQVNSAAPTRTVGGAWRITDRHPAARCLCPGRADRDAQRHPVRHLCHAALATA